MPTSEPKAKGKRVSAFADLTDGRAQGSWRPRYRKIARERIRCEAAYMACLLFACPVLMFVIWSGAAATVLRIPPDRAQVFERYSFAWLSGMLGGSLISMKWLYRSVAHGFWNWDRVWWRLFAPQLSGGLAFILFAATRSLNILSADVSQGLASVVAVSALVGLFSDNALAKLSEVAITLFGRVSPEDWPEAKRTPVAHDTPSSKPGPDVAK